MINLSKIQSNFKVNRVTDSDNAIPTWQEVKSRMLASYMEISSNTTATPDIAIDGVQNYIYKNIGSSDITIAISTTNTVIIDENDSLTVSAGKYAEISFLRINNIYYVRSIA